MHENSLTRLKQWLNGKGNGVGNRPGNLTGDERPSRAPRNIEPPLVVHYWNGEAPNGRRLRDISQSGAYIVTPERWYPGTIIRIVLQGCQTAPGGDPPASTCIPARVVRQGSDGVAVEFTFRDQHEEDDFRTFLAAIPAQPEDTLSSPAALRREALEDIRTAE